MISTSRTSSSARPRRPGRSRTSFPSAQLEFGRRFLPEALARTDRIAFLSDGEKRVLNQVRGHEYLTIFGLVEEFILPFVLDHARPQLNGDDHRVRALLNFAGEEAKRRRRRAGFRLIIQGVTHA